MLWRSRKPGTAHNSVLARFAFVMMVVTGVLATIVVPPAAAQYRDGFRLLKFAEVDRRYLPNPHKRELDALTRRMKDAQKRYLSRPERPWVPAHFAGRVTILLIMKPGNKGIRRFNKRADPVLCFATTCFISRGAQYPAKEARRRKTFGIVNTLGKRAGACSGQTHCIFRNIDLRMTRPVVQPVDLRLVRHDRRRKSRIAPDHTCRLVQHDWSPPHLTCAGGIKTATYVAWIVPEQTAAQAGAHGLWEALFYDLPAALAPAVSPRKTSPRF